MVEEEEKGRRVFAHTYTVYLEELPVWKVVPPLKHECRRSR